MSVTNANRSGTYCDIRDEQSKRSLQHEEKAKEEIAGKI